MKLSTVFLLLCSFLLVLNSCSVQKNETISRKNFDFPPYAEYSYKKAESVVFADSIKKEIRNDAPVASSSDTISENALSLNSQPSFNQKYVLKDQQEYTSVSNTTSAPKPMILPHRKFDFWSLGGLLMSIGAYTIIFFSPLKGAFWVTLALTFCFGGIITSPVLSGLGDDERAGQGLGIIASVSALLLLFIGKRSYWTAIFTVFNNGILILSTVILAAYIVLAIIASLKGEKIW